MKRLVNKIKKSVTGDCAVLEIHVDEVLGAYEITLAVKDITIDDSSVVSNEEIKTVYKESFYDK